MEANSTRNYLQQNLCQHFQEAAPSTSSSSHHPIHTHTHTQMREWLKNSYIFPKRKQRKTRETKTKRNLILLELFL